MSETKMGRKKLQIKEKSRALTLLEKGESVIAAARDIGVSREEIYQLKRFAASLSPGMVTKHHCHLGWYQNIIVTWDGNKTSLSPGMVTKHHCHLGWYQNIIVTWDGTKTKIWLWRTKENFSKNR